MKKLIALLLTACLCLSGCSDTQRETEQFSTNQSFDETTENKKHNYDYNLVNAPSEAYVIERLKQVTEISEVVGNCLDEDTTHREGCTALIYFSSSLINQDDIYGDTIEEKGTDCGGSIEIFVDEESALKRDEYLKGFDNSLLFNSGYHTVIGTIVIRTSKELDQEEQKTLENSIIENLTSEEIKEPINTTITPVETTSETTTTPETTILSTSATTTTTSAATTTTSATTTTTSVATTTTSAATTTTSVATTIATITSSYYSKNYDDNNSVTVPDKEETEGNLVWVPVNGGTKYHCYSGCSNMDNPKQVTIETAIANGYTACGRCY